LGRQVLLGEYVDRRQLARNLHIEPGARLRQQSCGLACHEADILIDDCSQLAPEQAGYWHDAGHAEVLHRLGLIDRHAWLDGWSRRLVGAHLHDVIGLGDHRAPGDGDVDWGYIVAGVSHLPGYTLEINQHQSDEKVRAAIGFLERIGLR